MKLYLVDDDYRRHNLIPKLLIELKKITPNNIKWENGWGDRKTPWTLFKDSKNLIKAILDPDGVLLIDIDLGITENSKIAEVKSDLDRFFYEKYPEVKETFENNLEIKRDFKRGPRMIIGSYLFSAALTLNKPYVLVTGVNVPAQSAKRNNRPHCEMPRDEDHDYQRMLVFVAEQIISCVDEYACAEKLCSSLSSCAHTFFPAGVNAEHRARDWFLKIDQGSMLPKKTDKMLTQVGNFLKEILRDIEGVSDNVDIKTAVSLMRSLKQNKEFLSVPFIDYLFNIDSKAVIKSPFHAIKCNGVSPGRIIKALCYFIYSKNNSEVIKVKALCSFDDIKSNIDIVFETYFNSGDDANKAKETLELLPGVRMERDNRASPGEAVTALNWLRQSSKERPIFVINDSMLTIVLSFDCAVIE